MSSLLRFPRRSQHDLKPGDGHPSPLPSPHAAPSFTESTRERRLSALSFISDKFSNKSKLKWPMSSSRLGIGHTVDFPRTYSRESTPSPTGSLEDIRMPVGLGRRASESELQPLEVPDTQDSFLAVPAGETRGRAHSAPGATGTRSVKRKNVPLLSALDGSPTGGPAISRTPVELLTVVFSFARQRDVLSLSRVSKAFSDAALRALYARLDLRILSQERVDQCVGLLASNREFASYVRHFACSTLPPAEDSTSTFDTVTFAVAFSNMRALESLTLPDYDPRFLLHITFRLKRLRIMSESISADNWRSFWTWLAKQPDITSLSFPHIIHSIDDCHLPDTPPPVYGPDLDTLLEDTIAPAANRLLPLYLVPHLTHFHGPAALAAAIIPGRPVTSVILHIHTTLYEGLKPSAIMSAMTRSRACVSRLMISVSLTQVDRRTLERVFMSTGAELGSQLEALAVEWALEDEVLYRQLSAVLPRFRTLHTLRLRRRKVELSWRLTEALNAFPSPPESPLEPASPGGLVAAPVSDIPVVRAQERNHVAGWAKQCPTLRSVLFLSGAEWRTGRAGGLYALPGEGRRCAAVFEVGRAMPGLTPEREGKFIRLEFGICAWCLDA